MELNKIFASILLAGVIAMTAGFVSDLVIRPGTLEQNVFLIDTGAEPTDTDQPDVVVAAIGSLIQDADPQAGQALTRACAACHTFEQGGANRVGPNLYDVVGGSKAHIEGFNYSAAMREAAAAGETWGYDELNQFLENPRGYMPGTTMAYAGLRNDQDRADLIAYLRTLSDDPEPLPDPGEGVEAAPEGEAPAPADDEAEPAVEPPEEVDPVEEGPTPELENPAEGGADDEAGEPAE